MFDQRIPRTAGSEVWPSWRNMSISLGIPKRKGVVVERWLGEVERAGGGILATIGIKELQDIIGLFAN